MASATDSSPLTVEATRAYKQQVQDVAAFLAEKHSPLPPTALLLEPGIGRREGELRTQSAWSFSDLPHFPERDESDRVGRLAIGAITDCPVLLLEGALSLQEGFTPRDVAFPVRVLAEAGVDRLVITNTSSSVNPVIRRGALVLLRDHINFQGANPLVGPNVEDWGPRFPDMTEPYDSEFREAARDVALENDVNLHEGVFGATLGPNAGTNAEARMMQTLGADVIGTTAVPEVIAARHMNVRVLAMSLVTEYSFEDTSPTMDDGEDRASWQSSLWEVLSDVVVRIGTGRVA